MAGSALTSADFPDLRMGATNTALGLGTLAEARLLLIDDSRFARKIINAILANQGFTNVQIAVDGEEGLRIAREWHPEIVITDLFMPVKNGFDVCRELRQDKEFEETPIIVQTSADTPSLRGDVFEAGASDLINKPINARELLSRIRVHLERLRLLESLKTYQRQMREELNAAKAMQVELLPADQLLVEIEQNFPLKVAWYSQPCQSLAGDIWGAEQLDERRVRVWNADFTGHGVRSALNTFRLNTFLRTSLKADTRGPADWLATVNDFLCEVLPLGQFATMLCCDIDFDEDMIEIASAGAPEPILQQDGQNMIIPLGGIPLGISKGASFETRPLPFVPGSCLFAYSDALIETPSAERPLYDMEGLRERLDQLGQKGLAQRPITLLDDLLKVAPKGLDDDLTMIFLEYRRVQGGRERLAVSEVEAAETQALVNEIAPEAIKKKEPKSEDVAGLIERTFCEPVTSAEIKIRTMQEASMLAERLAQQYPDPALIQIGIWELLANAIEHGNLGISHDEKTELLMRNELDAEIELRLTLPGFRERRVHVKFHRLPSQLILRILDEGEGFDYETYLNGEARLDAPNGRGIAIAQKLSFDLLSYSGGGNCVEAVINLPISGSDQAL